MDERYTRLFALENNIYSEGSPVIISAGALLKDNMTGKVLAQLKVKNINIKPVKAIKVKILPKDTIGDPLGEPELFQYLDLDAKRDEEFGQKQPNVLSDNTIRSYSVEVTEVYFSDNSKWEGIGATWEPIQDIRKLDELLLDQEMLKQYRIKYGDDCEYIPEKVNDLWYCTCGAINHDSELKCHKCNKPFEKLFSLNLSELEAEKVARLRETAEKEAEKQKKATAKKKKTIKLTAIIAACVVVIAAVILLLTLVIIPYSKKNKAYNDAIAAYESGDYDAAISAFANLQDFKDSQEQFQEVSYQKAEYLYSNQDYESAKSVYISLGEYKDSKSRVNDCDIQITEIENMAQYNSGLESLNAGNFEWAIREFSSLQDYSDSAEQLIKAKQMKYDYALELESKEDAESKQNAFKLFSELEDYKDSHKMALEAEKEMYIIEFCTADYDDDWINKAKEATDYFMENVNNGTFKWLNSDEILSGIVGSWEVFPYDDHYDSHKVVTFYSDGTCTESSFPNKTMEWGVSEKGFYYWLTMGHLAAKIDENHWLIFQNLGTRGAAFRSIYVRQ